MHLSHPTWCNALELDAVLSSRCIARPCPLPPGQRLSWMCRYLTCCEARISTNTGGFELSQLRALTPCSLDQVHVSLGVFDTEAGQWNATFGSAPVPSQAHCRFESPATNKSYAGKDCMISFHQPKSSSPKTPWAQVGVAASEGGARSAACTDGASRLVERVSPHARRLRRHGAGVTTQPNETVLHTSRRQSLLACGCWDSRI